MQRLHQDDGDYEQHLFDLDEIARQGARRMLAEALEAEVQNYVEATREERDERGHALVVRNGYARGCYELDQEWLGNAENGEPKETWPTVESAF